MTCWPIGLIPARDLDAARAAAAAASARYGGELDAYETNGFTALQQLGGDRPTTSRSRLILAWCDGWLTARGLDEHPTPVGVQWHL